MGGKRDNKEWDLNREPPFLRVSWYKRRSDIKEVDIMDFRVYLFDSLQTMDDLWGMEPIHKGHPQYELD
jgi:hypothetical protein